MERFEHKAQRTENGGTKYLFGHPLSEIKTYQTMQTIDVFSIDSVFNGISQ